VHGHGTYYIKQTFEYRSTNIIGTEGIEEDREMKKKS
jgi:hypothetical protein